MSQDNRQLPKTQIEGNTPLDLKGKGKQTKKENTIPIVDRLQSSGRLVLDAFGSGPELSGQQPARKADPSGSNSNSIDKISSSTGEASSHRLRSSIQAETLRSKTNLDSGPSAQAFNDFVSADVTLDVDNDNDNANLDEEARKQIYHSKSTHASHDVSEQEKLDGAAVVSLLDGHSDELDAVLVGSHDPIAEADDDPLTPEAAAKLREALFSNNSVSSGPSLSDLLNFNPGFLDQPGPEAEFERQLYLGTRDTDQARSSWLQQWGDVLAGYTDHVWGDLEPLITEARREVEESKAQGPGAVSETKALDRLRQVLAHIRWV
ncbi:hypothetical protein FVEN_g11556 [Fusarium venenatum]|uniref:Uncharacterized protein n=1 Tax=Fusarium venenatum TaxID=56646 RepID=A0A2L2TX10_9HYPO|nr:uncharacterized protein FVRRES_01677 [Fusarium venenatum]KAG8350323.1 hypothetical protein FVEN_g11556 [Fusarium venenatum]KAH7005166.1 hypothetical protein EDB82DRAFT_471894 [Fusarium venenatum]CEI65165.1 unnamed protein product [Fusarium venenatum]